MKHKDGMALPGLVIAAAGPAFYGVAADAPALFVQQYAKPAASPAP